MSIRIFPVAGNVSLEESANIVEGITSVQAVIAKDLNVSIKLRKVTIVVSQFKKMIVNLVLVDLNASRTDALWVNVARIEQSCVVATRNRNVLLANMVLNVMEVIASSTSVLMELLKATIAAIRLQRKTVSRVLMITSASLPNVRVVNAVIMKL